MKNKIIKGRSCWNGKRWNKRLKRQTLQATGLANWPKSHHKCKFMAMSRLSRLCKYVCKCVLVGRHATNVHMFVCVCQCLCAPAQLPTALNLPHTSTKSRQRVCNHRHRHSHHFYSLYQKSSFYFSTQICYLTVLHARCSTSSQHTSMIYIHTRIHTHMYA